MFLIWKSKNKLRRKWNRLPGNVVRMEDLDSVNNTKRRMLVDSDVQRWARTSRRGLNHFRIKQTWSRCLEVSVDIKTKIASFQDQANADLMCNVGPHNGNCWINGEQHDTREKFSLYKSGAVIGRLAQS